jgi:hypothetical protein
MFWRLFFFFLQHDILSSPVSSYLVRAVTPKGIYKGVWSNDRMISRGKLKNSGKEICSIATSSALNLNMGCCGLNLGWCRENPVSNCLSYGMESILVLFFWGGGVLLKVPDYWDIGVEHDFWNVELNSTRDLLSNSLLFQ